MKNTIFQSIAYLCFGLMVGSLNACSVETQTLPTQTAMLEASAGSMPTTSSSLPHREIKHELNREIKHADNGAGLGGYAQLWANSDPANKTGNHAQSDAAALQTSTSVLKQTQEYKQLRIVMNTNNFERAKQMASTPELKAVVEQEQAMHVEMLATELVSAQADRESGPKER